MVNELTTEAIKHASEDGNDGHINLSFGKHGEHEVTVIVDNEGLPFPEVGANAGGLGMDLVKRLMVSIGGFLAAAGS